MIPNRTTNYFIIDQPLEVQKIYSDYLINSGITKCNCINHYDITTLSNKGIKINYKSFKKMTLKKMLTKSKKPVITSSKLVEKTQIDIEKAKQKLKNLELKQIFLIENKKKYIEISSKLTEAIKLM